MSKPRSRNKRDSTVRSVAHLHAARDSAEFAAANDFALCAATGMDAVVNYEDLEAPDESRRKKRDEIEELIKEDIARQAAFDAKRLPPQEMLDASRAHIVYLRDLLREARVVSKAAREHGGKITKTFLFHLRIPPKFLKNHNYGPIEPFFPLCLYNDVGHIMDKPEFPQLIQYVEYCFSIFSLGYPRKPDQGRFCYGCAFNARRLVTWLLDGIPCRRTWYKNLQADASTAEACFRFHDQKKFAPAMIPDLPYCPPSAVYVNMMDYWWWNEPMPMVQMIKSRQSHGWWDRHLIPNSNFVLFSNITDNIWGDVEHKTIIQRGIDETVVSFMGSKQSPYTHKQELESLKRLCDTDGQVSWFHQSMLDELSQRLENEPTTEEQSQITSIQPEEAKPEPSKKGAETRKERRARYLAKAKKN